MTVTRNSLPPGYKLHWYLIRDVLGQGGFGITYLAQDTNLDHPVAIKEFLPVEIAVRLEDSSVHPVSGEKGENFQWGLDRFISEAQTLARFRHDNIVRVLTVFTENNTAYMVMEYEQGHGLHEILKNRERLPERQALDFMLPILDGLEQVHAAGFIHRDIKPPNIYIRDDGSPVLIDFGSARQSLGEHTHTLTTMVSPGYAPFEQYVSKSDKQGPWTDIYGLGATMYRSVTGKSPPNALDRSEALLHTGKDIYVRAADICTENYSSSFLRAIDHAMAFKADDRPRDIIAWRAEIQGATAVECDNVETEVAPQANRAVVAGVAEIRTIGSIIPPAARTGNEGEQQLSRQTARATGSGKFPRRLVWAIVIVAIAIVLMKLPEQRGLTSPPQTSASDSGLNETVTVKSDVPDTAGDRTEETDQAAIITDVPRVDKTLAPEPDRSAPPTMAVTQIPPDLISDSDRRRLALLMNRLRKNPNDKKAELQLLKMFKNYETRVRNTLDVGDLSRAESYIGELTELAPDNRKLQQALERIRKAREVRSGN